MLSSFISDTEKADPFQLYVQLLNEYIHFFFPSDNPLHSASSASSTTTASPFGHTPQTPQKTPYNKSSRIASTPQSPPSFLHSPSSVSPYRRTPSSYSSPSKSYSRGNHFFFLSSSIHHHPASPSLFSLRATRKCLQSFQEILVSADRVLATSKRPIGWHIRK